MSGNPFRASLVVQNLPTAAPPTSFPPADSSNRREEGREGREDDSVFDASSAPPSKTKKSVRIEAPTEAISPHPAFRDVDDETYHGLSHGRRAGSPPSEPSPAFTDDCEVRYPQDPTGREGDERGILGDIWKSTGTSESVQLPSGAPANPFSRTLATIEPQEKSGEEIGPSKERTATEKSMPGSKRQSLNVEGFKNLLLQGIISPRSSGPPQNVLSPNLLSPTPAIFESSSGTDSSSVSRQSIFDPPQEPHPESPRTSYDMAASDDEHVSLMGGEAPKREKKKPPPAPRHRHGKLVRERIPQTVSFESFSAANTSPELKPPKRTDSDTNKPLPPTPPTTISPPTHIISQDTTHETASISDARDSEAASITEATPAPTQKKVPPPVPLARRQSQLRSSTAGKRSRSNSSLTMSSQQSTEIPPIHSTQTQEPTSHPATTQKAPPPPPPSRRHGNALSTKNTSSANLPPTELSHPSRPAMSSPNPPSSSRRTTVSSEPGSPAPGLTRTSSMHSSRNTSRAVSHESTNTNTPPPPPPPRRRQSGRSSLDMQRPTILSSPGGSSQTSTEWKRNSRSSIDGKRQGSIASVSSLSRQYTPVAGDEQALYSPREEVEELGGLGIEKENTGGKAQENEPGVGRRGGSNASNILDDMEKFQREIDELRSRYEKAA